MRSYPVTVICDRYQGLYSGGRYTAWPTYSAYIPDEICGDNIACAAFWRNFFGMVGKGNTEEDALGDLDNKMKTANDHNSFSCPFCDLHNLNKISLAKHLKMGDCPEFDSIKL